MSENVAALLEAVAEDGLEGLGLGKTVQRQLCRCLPALNLRGGPSTVYR